MNVGPLRMLIVVEDNDEFLVLRHLLRRTSLAIGRIDRASSREEALAALRQAAYCIALVDGRLGTHAGIELLADATAVGIDTPMIVLTSVSEPEVKQRALEAGAFDYLVKGEIHPDTLERSIRYILGCAEARGALQISRRLLRIANRHSELRPLLAEFVTEIRRFTGCAAVGIRLVDGNGNMPFQQAEGYSEAFLQRESPRSIQRDCCLCAQLLTGALAAGAPGLTEQGAFATGRLPETLGQWPEGQRAGLGTACLGAGYESLALIPIRMGQKASGLIHLADPRPNALPQRIVSILEGLAMQLAEALQRIASEESLRARNRALQTLNQCNEVLVRAEKESDLLENVCRTLVESGGYRMAWVGFAESNGKNHIRPAATAGHDDGYLAAVKRQCHASDSTACPSLRAVTQRRLCQIGDIRAEGPRTWQHEALQRGYASAIAIPLLTDAERAGVLSIYAARPHAFDAEEVNLLTRLADDLSYGIAALRTRTELLRTQAVLQRSVADLQETLRGTIQAVSFTVEMRDAYTAGHQRRVASLAQAMAQEIGLPASAAEGVYIAATVHDIGKISVPAEILSKPARLTPAEMNLIKTHPQMGSDILRTIPAPWPLADIVLQHHERLNGNGYPLGLSGDRILLEARIIAVADVVEAMASHRPYRPALGIEAALREIEGQKGILYDPQAVEVCLGLFHEKNFRFPAATADTASRARDFTPSPRD